MGRYKPSTTKYSIRLEDSKVEFLKELYGDLGITSLINSLIDERLEHSFSKSSVKEGRVKSPIIRIGGKSKIANQIIDIFPKHKVYVDVFGGAGHILFAKPQEISNIEVLNDKYGEIYNFFKILQTRPLELREYILKTPVSRKLYEEMQRDTEGYTDAVERAFSFFYLNRNSYYGDARTGYRISKEHNIRKLMERIANDLVIISKRLSKVIIENKDYSYVLKKYDSKDTLFYVDPPYLVERKSEGIYELKFTEADTKKLIHMLKEIEGKFVLSHYENDLYERLLEGYPSYSIRTVKASGKVDGENKKPRVVEKLYCNFDEGGNRYPIDTIKGNRYLKENSV